MSCRLAIALTVTMAVAMLLPSLATAQMRGGHFGGAAAPRTGARYGYGARAGFGSRGGRGLYGGGGLYFPGYFPGYGFYGGWGYLPVPLDLDYGLGYGNDYGYDNGYGPMAGQAPPPWLIGTHSEPASAQAQPVEPMVLERQGDQWVRIGGYGQPPAAAPSAVATAAQAPNPSSDMGERNNAAQPAPKLPAAVLVFRDGHQEEIEKYTIIGPVIFAQADYWTTGSWRKKVAIADLDIPATLKLNRARGAKFSLPSGPNEVIFRP